MAAMDFDGAIQAHAAWKLKLGSYLRRPDRSIDHNVLCRDDRCELGKWIHGEGRVKYAGLPEFKTLQLEHASFHLAAAEVVRLADRGEATAADTSIGGSSKFATASKAVVVAIVRMRTKTA